MINLRIGYVYEISGYTGRDWAMLAHAGNNKVVAICSDGNRYRHPFAVSNLLRISSSEFRAIDNRVVIDAGRLSVHICDDNVNYPKPLERFDGFSYGTCLINSKCEWFILAQVDTSIVALIDCHGQPLAPPIVVDRVGNITPSELFRIGVTEDMLVVGKTFDVLHFNRGYDV